MQLPNRIRTGRKRPPFGLASLLREKGRDMLVFAFFLAVSFGFWLLQKLDDTFDADIRVPLELVGVPKGTVITTPLPSEVTVTIQDRGTNLFNYRRRSKGIQPIKLDFSVYDAGAAAGKASVSATDVQRAFLQQMGPTTQVLRLSPSKFEFHYNRGLFRRVPVRFSGTVSASRQNYLQEITISPDSVTVYAPSSILDTLKYAYTVSYDFKDLRQTTDFTLSFQNVTGVKTVPEQVTMTAHVDYYTEQTVQVPVIGLNFPADMTLRTFPPTVTIKYRVGAAVSRYINAENFVLAPTYEELLTHVGQKYPLTLKSIPSGVSNVRIYPQQVEFLLENVAVEEGLSGTLEKDDGDD